MDSDDPGDFLDSKFTSFKQKIMKIIDDRMTELANHFFERVDELEKKLQTTKVKIAKTQKK